jgi:hypothetical protein
MPRPAVRSSAQLLSICLLGLTYPGTLAYAASCVVAPATPPPPLDAAVKRTVVITDAALLNNANPALGFSLGRTLGNIVKTTPGMVDSPAERIALLTSLVRSFRAISHVNPDSQVTLPVPVRAAEAALDPIALLDPANPNGMKPVGLFNRYDLAPADFKTCGEHRIVYAKNSSSPTDRFLLIFEAALDNPKPDLGAEGCRPIAEFWDSLKGKTGNDLAMSLSKFYYDGLAPGIEPVVHFTNYGLPFGQVRGNLFKQQPWQLREWRISAVPDGAPVFVPVTVKTNPFPPLYGGPVSGENSGIAALRPAFQAEFSSGRVPELVSVDQGGIVNPESAVDLLFQLGAALPNKYNGFESTSQIPPGNDNPQALATPSLKGKITQRLNQIGIGSACQLTDEHILNRAGALSCGGCHQFTVGKPIAPGVNWPGSLGFVQIDETGTLSQALEQFFLPARQQNLARHLQVAPAAAASAAGPPTAAATVSGVQTAVQALRLNAANLPNAESRLSAINSLTELEKQVQSARATEQATPGAFVTFRRPH